MLDRFDDGRDLSKGLDLSKLSGRSRELVDRGLLGSARHNEALNAGKRRELDAKSWGKVKSEIPEGTKVWVDEELPIGEVRVEYDAPGGVVKAESVRIVTGPGPEAKRIRLHGETVRLVRKYSGLQGEVRRLLSRLRFYLTGVDRGAGSVLWEAKMEVEKLDRGMSEWMGDLLGADPGGAGAEKARRELEGIGGQYEYWRRVSEGEISRRESRGYIAMEGDEASLGLEALEEAGDGAGGSRLGGETEAGDGKRVYAPGAAERRVLPEGEGARVSQESSVSSAAGGGIPVKAGLARTADIKAALGARGAAVGKGRTVAFAEVDVAGVEVSEVIGVSGRTGRGGALGESLIAGPTTRTGPGRLDAEVKILDELRPRLTPESRGTIRLFVDQPAAKGVCQNCTDAIFQFQRDFPGIRIIPSAN
ncbi:hypothetical protein G6O69_01110 [Pseudenhygromyxa sp. WMMC2535]|uniref:hypothetical protein n=1 Tax=Pseudenhygromyxa sp. WMMC2535 TaxID=2712867 RepID=UPI001553ABC7|nr:hypothetical protein [Pseudenhygromyxa sp. WMMC2535]NVB36410.1 hypothetical protein [Pseudenhygromyxa sp. WMMC2535]